MTMQEETWLPVVGYEGLYEVSSLGRVRSLDRVVDQGCKGHRLIRGRILRERIDVLGRPTMTLAVAGKKKQVRASVLVLEAFVGPRPPGFACCHNDGDPSNNRLGNLRWDTLTANNYDAVRHGTHTNAAKVRCPRGHSLQAPNNPPWSANLGHRTCFACQRARGNERRAKRRGEDFGADDFLAAANNHFARIMSAG